MRILLPVMFIVLSFVSVVKAQQIPHVPFNSWDWNQAQLEIVLVEIEYLLALPDDATELEMWEYIANYDLEILEQMYQSAYKRWYRIGTVIETYAFFTDQLFPQAALHEKFQPALQSIKVDMDFFYLILDLVLNPPEELPPPEE